MSKAQLVITAVVLEGRSKTAVARDYDLSRLWVHQLVSRYHKEGAVAFKPRSRRPQRCPAAISAAGPPIRRLEIISRPPPADGAGALRQPRRSALRSGS